MERVHRRGRRIGARIPDRLIVDDGSRCGVGRDDERLDVEAADEPSGSAPVTVGLDVALIPGHSERSVRNLGDEEVELRVGRKALHADAHLLHRAEGLDLDVGGRVRQAVRIRGRRRPHHVELDLVLALLRLGGHRHRDCRKDDARRGSRRQRLPMTPCSLHHTSFRPGLRGGRVARGRVRSDHGRGVPRAYSRRQRATSPRRRSGSRCGARARSAGRTRARCAASGRR